MSIDKKINYVAAFYFGERRGDQWVDRTQSLGSIDCLKTHVRSLIDLKHNLSRITFVVNGDIPEEYDFIVKPLKEKYDFETLQRENIGISYGAYSHAVSKNIKDFDFFIFTEDDWIFCEDNFDRYFVEKFNEKEKTSMVCLVSSRNLTGRYRSLELDHAAVSIYGTSKQVLEMIVRDYHTLPFSIHGYQNGQVFQTSIFFNYGLVVDAIEDFQVRFSDPRGIQTWNSGQKEICKQYDLLITY